MFRLSWVWPVRVPSSCILYPFDVSPSFLDISSFALVKDIPGMSHTFPGPVLESVIIGSGIWFYLTCKLIRACYSFMDAGRRQETPESETKDFITHGTGNKMNISIIDSVFLPPSPIEAMWNGTDGYMAVRLHYSWRTLSLENPLLFFFCLLSFWGPHPQYMEVPRLQVSLELCCSCQPMPEPQQRQIQAAPVTYTTAHCNAGSLTHWVKPGIKPATSWFLVGFVSTAPWQELQESTAFIASTKEVFS